MVGGKIIMINIIIREGLIYINVTLTHKDKSFNIKNALVDTGSSSTVICRNIAHKLGLKPEPNDLINSVQGVGGTESVYEKKIDSIKLDSLTESNFNIQVGAMDYGIELNAIIGLDLLIKCRALLDLNKFTLITTEV